MKQKSIDFKEVEKNLYDSFNSFFKFSLNLIEGVDKNTDYYKFAVVNIQITLELFLKYYFIKKKLGKYVIDSVNSNGIKYKDFSVVLNNYFRVNKWTYGRKKELKEILETRNRIVHCGNDTQWNKEIVGYIIRCIFFMHGIMNYEFDELLISDNKIKLKGNALWTESVEEFINDLLSKGDFPVKTCLSCGEYTLIPKEVFEMGERTSSVAEDLVCLNCLDVYKMKSHNIIIDCYNCVDGSYLVHLLNPQEHQLYVGKCTECETDTWIRKCAECERLYHPSEEQEVNFHGKYFCSESCLECYKDAWSIT